LGNNDGVWNEEGASIKVTVVPPFWETWWFRGIVVLLLVGSAIGGYRLRVRSIEARSRELEKQVKQRTAELQEAIEQRLQVEEALRQSEMEKAVAAERSRLARELHDAVTQTLFSMTLNAQAARTLLERDPERVEPQLARLQKLAQGALAEMRSLIFQLRPATTEQVGLVPALRKHLAELKSREGLEVELHVEGEEPLPREQERGLFRIAQEALNNVVKHAQTDRAEVTLTMKDGGTSLLIEDHGVGFDPSAFEPGKETMGLISMRERAELMEGIFEVESCPGEGTRIRVEIPQTEGDENHG